LTLGILFVINPFRRILGKTHRDTGQYSVLQTKVKVNTDSESANSGLSRPR
jgi:hypothetical protein